MSDASSEHPNERAAFIEELKQSQDELQKCIAVAEALLAEQESERTEVASMRDRKIKEAHANDGELVRKAHILIATSAKSVEDSRQLINSAHELNKRTDDRASSE